MRSCLKFGRTLSRVAWYFVPCKRKQTAIKNIQCCLNVSNKEAVRIAKLNLTNLGATFIEVLSFPKIKKNIDTYVEITGMEHLRNCRPYGIIVSGHIDNWELIGASLVQSGIPLACVAKKQRSIAVDKFINELRTEIGMNVVYHSKVREIYRLMTQGYFVGLIMDQDVSRHDGIVVKFFNRATNFVVGAASISRFKHSPIIPVFMHRNSDDTHTLEILPPIYTQKTNNRSSDIKKVTQILANLIENHIKKYPTEWFWLHDRWKSIRVEFKPEEIKKLDQELQNTQLS